MLAIAAVPFAMVSCDDDDYWGYDYDDPYYYWGYDGPDNWHGHGGHHDGDYEESDDLVLMAQFLSAAGWSGQMNSTFTEGGVRVSKHFTVECEFHLSSVGATGGRGTETTWDDQGNEATRTFTWSINERTGDITMNYDDGMQMLVDYDTLYLDNNEFSGTMKGINNDEVDEFSYTKATYAKGEQTQAKTKVFGGKAGTKIVNKKVVSK